MGAHATANGALRTRLPARRCRFRASSNVTSEEATVPWGTFATPVAERIDAGTLWDGP